MFAYVNMHHEKMPTTMFRVKRGRRYVIYCRNILGLTAAATSARVARQRYNRINARVMVLCKRIGEHMFSRTQDLSNKLEAMYGNTAFAAEADTGLYTIISLNMAKRLVNLKEAFTQFESPFLKPGEKEELLAEMQALIDAHTREDFAQSQARVSLRTKKRDGIKSPYPLCA